MLNIELKNYIQSQKEAGVDTASIRQALLEVGWKKEDIDSHINSIESNNVQKPAIDSFLKASVLFSKTIKYYKSNFIKILLLSLPLIILSSLLLFLPNIFSSEFILNPPDNTFFTMLSYLLVSLLEVIFSIITLLSIIHLINDSRSNIKSSYKKAFNELLSYIWIILLSGFIIFIGYVLFIVPGIILSILFSLTIFTLISDKEKGLNAIVKSREYLRGYTFAFIIKSIFLSVMLLIIGGILLMLFSIISIFIPYNLFVTEILQLFLNYLFVVPVSLIFLYFVYSNLKFLRPEIISMKITSKQKRIYLIFAVLGFIILSIICISFISIFINNKDLYFGTQSIIKGGRFLGL